MDSKTVALLCNPTTRESLQLLTVPGVDGDVREILIGTETGQTFPVQNGIPMFLSGSEMRRFDKKYQRLFDTNTPLYDISTEIYATLMSEEEQKERREQLDELEIIDGDRVLEMSIGSGIDLAYLPKTAEYFGLDASRGTLKQCKRNLEKLDLAVELILGAPENLPFKDDVFDLAFHMGGKSLLANKSRIINEMVRVAKPGGRIVIVDKSNNLTKTFEKKFLPEMFFNDRGERAVFPMADVVDLLSPRLPGFGIEETIGGNPITEA